MPGQTPGLFVRLESFERRWLRRLRGRSRLSETRERRTVEMLGIALAAPRQSDDPLGHKLANHQSGIAIGKCGNGLVIGIAHGRGQLGSESGQARSEL